MFFMNGVGTRRPQGHGGGVPAGDGRGRGKTGGKEFSDHHAGAVGAGRPAVGSWMHAGGDGSDRGVLCAEQRIIREG